MLRLPAFELAQPATLDEALALLGDPEVPSLVVAGGTDLLPNLKHELHAPRRLVSLARIPGLRGVRALPEGGFVIGALTPLDEVARDAGLRARAPALAQACSLVAGPQLRSMGTLGGNVLLDTRCQWFNQSWFWRSALGFCLKKDGSACHVVEGGSKCVAAASNDSAPALMTLGAELEIAGPATRRRVALDEFWIADGTRNHKLAPGEILTAIRLPELRGTQRGAYGKLRERGSIDFPLLGVAARLELDPHGGVLDADVVLGALQARPVRLRKVRELLLQTRVGAESFESAVERVAEQAARQCHPLPNIPGDHDWRAAMVPVWVRRTLLAAARGEGPVQA